MHLKYPNITQKCLFKNTFGKFKNTYSPFKQIGDKVEEQKRPRTNVLLFPSLTLLLITSVIRDARGHVYELKCTKLDLQHYPS